MSIRTEQLQLRVVIDGSPARKELATLDQEYAKLNASQKELKRGTEDWVNSSKRMDEIRVRQAELRKEIGLTALTLKQLGDERRRLQLLDKQLTPETKVWEENRAQLEAVKQRMRELTDTNMRAAAAWEVQRKNIRLTDMTMEQLEQEASRLRAALHSMDPNTGEFRNLNRELRQVDDRMATLRNNLTPMQALWRNLKREMSGVLGLTVGLFAGGMLVSRAKQYVASLAEVSDQFANIQKTTDLTDQEMLKLERRMGQFNTRTARSELRELAAEAGHLGVRGVNDLQQFVRAGDKINVALGEDLGEGAIKQIGKLNLIFRIGEERGLGLEQQMLSTGSAINELEASSSASANFLVDYTNRMAGVHAQNGISIESTLGFGAAIDQLGLKSETSSTAMSRFLVDAYKETAVYAKIAGMEQKAFTDLLNSDANEALLRTLEGLNGNNEGMSVMVTKFQDMEENGARAIQVLSSLAANTKLVREQQAIANKAFAEGTSVQEEFNRKNSNFAANLEIIGKRIQSWFVNSAAIQWVNSMASAMRRWIEVPVSATLEQERIELLKLHAQILTTNEGSEERITLVKELQALYPGFLGNLEAEKVGNQELSAAVSELNKQLVNKIILQQKDEEIQEQAEAHAARQMRVLEQEDEVRTRMVKMAEANNMQLKEGVPLYEQAADLLGRIREEQRKTGQTPMFRGQLFNDVARFGKSIEQLRVSYSFLNSEQSLSNRLAEERAELVKRLGIDLNTGAAPSTGEGTTTTTTTTTTGGGLSEDEKEKMKAQLETWRQELKEHRERMYQDGLSADERDLRQLDVKHAGELAKLRANKLATEADLLALEATQAKERADLIAGQGEERLTGYSEAAERIRRATLLDAERELEDSMAHWDELIALGKEFGIDTTKLEEERQKALAAIRKKWADKEAADGKRRDAETLAARIKAMQEQIQVAQAFGGMLNGLSSMLGAFYKESEDRAFEHTVMAKTLAIVQMNIAAAVAIAEAVKSIMADPTAPFIVKLGYAAAAAGQVMAAVATAYDLINSSPNLSQTSGTAAGQGTPTNVPLGAQGGIFDGPGHDQGGLKVYDPQRGRVVAEVEGGEPWMVLSRAFRRNNPALIPMLMRASATGAHLPLGKRGGLFAPMPAFNFTQASEAMVPKMVGGGITSGGNRYTFTKGQGLSTNDDVTEKMLGLLESMDMRLASVAQGVRQMPTVLEARVALGDLERRKSEDSYIRDINKGRRNR